MTHETSEKRQARNCEESSPFIPLAVLTSTLRCSHLKLQGHQSSLTPGRTEQILWEQTNLHYYSLGEQGEGFQISPPVSVGI